MNFKASAKFVKKSPHKLRPIADVIRGKNAQYALNWLKVYGIKKAVPIQKLLESAVANVKNLDETIALQNLQIAEIRVDQGPAYKYFQPSAMGRSLVMRKRLSHISIVLKQIGLENKKND